MVVAQGYQRFPLSKPVVGPNTPVYAIPAYRESAYIVSAFPTHSTSFSPKFLQSSTAECVLRSEWKSFFTCGGNTFCFFAACHVIREDQVIIVRLQRTGHSSLAGTICSRNSALETPLCATAVHRPWRWIDWLIALSPANHNDYLRTDMTVEHFLQDC